MANRFDVVTVQAVPCASATLELVQHNRWRDSFVHCDSITAGEHGGKQD